MPSVKEIYHKIDDVRIEADSINLNVDGLEALASTQQADIADIKADLANGVTINQPVAVTDNNGSLTVDGTVTVGNNNFNIKTVIAQDGSANFTAFNGTQFRLYTPTGASKTLNNIFGSTPAWITAFSDSITWFSDSGTQVGYFHDGTQWTLDDFTTPAGTITLDGSVFITNLSSESFINLSNGFTASQVGSAYINDSGALRVKLYSSTVTASSDKGSISEASTQSITTGGTHQQVFASNASRKYLLIQNISDTDMYLGLGFNPSNTTPAGLLLAKSGGGIVFESSYIPTSEVRIVCATTGKRFVALQG